MLEEIVPVTADNHELLLLPSCVAVHSQLRSRLNRLTNSPPDYAAYIAQLCQSSDLHVCLVLRRRVYETTVVGLAVYGHHFNTANDLTFDLYDLVVDEKERNRGLGSRFFQHLIHEAKRGAAVCIVLHCDPTNTAAHRFFYRHGMAISSFWFGADRLESLASSPEIRVIDITDLPDSENEYWLERCQHVHRQFQPRLPTDQQEYIDQIRSICRSNPTRILLAISNDEQTNVLGLAACRIFDNIQYTKCYYCDDLVTDEPKRSLGVGRCLTNAMKAGARAAGASCVTLDSGCERPRAHKFYHREGFVIEQFEFTCSL